MVSWIWLAACLQGSAAEIHNEVTPWKLMTANSVFVCLTGPSDSSRGPGTVRASNCTADSREQLWLFPAEGFKQGPCKIPFARDPALCLGASLGWLGTFPCDGDVVPTTWEYTIEPRMEYKSFHLVHLGTGQCLKWKGERRGGLPGVVALEQCPIGITVSPYDSADFGHAENGSVVDSSADAALERFIWLAVAKAGIIPDAELPLRVSGSDMVGQSGRVASLRGVNWYGAHMSQRINNGMNDVTLDEFVRILLNLGFNLVRMNYATQFLLEDFFPNASLFRANPQFANKSAVEIFDLQVEALTKAGVLVIIANHVTTNGWCCSLDDGNALWFNKDWSEQTWLDGLSAIAARYRYNPRVIGMDLRNEPRPDMGRADHPHDPHYMIWWGHMVKGFSRNYFAADFRIAAMEGAKAVWHQSPEALIFVEGTLGATDLSEVMTKKMEFGQECLHSRVAYSVHDYIWFDRWHEIIKGLDFGHLYSLHVHIHWKQLNEAYFNVRANEMVDNFDEFAAFRDYSWGYLEKEDKAPVWVGEFGSGERTNWWIYFLRYMAQSNLDWTYWSIDGEERPRGDYDGRHHLGYGERYGVLTKDYLAFRGMWKMRDLGGMLASAGMQNRTRPHPGDCTFDPLRNPMKGLDAADHTFSLQQMKALASVACFLLVGTLVGAVCCCFCCCIKRDRCAAFMLKREAADRDYSKVDVE